MQAQPLASTDFSRPNMEMEMRRELQTFQQQVSKENNTESTQKQEHDNMSQQSAKNEPEPRLQGTDCLRVC